MLCVEASVTEIKIEPSNQSSFWRANQAINVTSKLIKICGYNLTFDPLKTKQSRASEGNNQTINLLIKILIPVASTSTGDTYVLPLLIVMFYKVGVAMYDFVENI